VRDGHMGGTPRTAVRRPPVGAVAQDRTTGQCMNPTSRSKLRTHAVEHSNEGDGEMTTSKNQGTALVTGASSGIGAIYADRRARRDARGCAK
jgi:alkaline phosphatase